MDKLQIETLVLGMISTNCYLVMNKETKALLIVDPADESQRIINRIAELQAKPEAVLLTHGHFDHTGAASALHDRYGIPVCAFEDESQVLENVAYNHSGMYGRTFTVKADRFFHDGEIADFVGVNIQVLHTPGHTTGGACYYVESEKVLLSGDTLFFGSVGRTDLPTGNMRELHDSVHQKLFVLPEDTLVFPGHGEATSIGYEKQYNPY